MTYVATRKIREMMDILVELVQLQQIEIAHSEVKDVTKGQRLPRCHT